MDTLNIRCVIVDDEPLAIEKLKGFVSKVPYLQLVATYRSAIEAIPLLQAENVDLLFLDIQMEDFTGIQLLEVLKNKPCVIFTTGYSEYAVKGYELDVCDYLLKPISFERFMLAVNKIIEKLRQKPENDHVINTEIQVSKAVDFMLVKADYYSQKIAS